eukprot:791936-Amphidinium_carterae.1
MKLTTSILEDALAELLERATEELDADNTDSNDGDNPVERAKEAIGASEETMFVPLVETTSAEASQDAEAVSYVHLRVWTRGGFTFTRKQGRGQGGASMFRGMQTSCPWHARNDKTVFQKFMSMISGTPQARLEVMRQLCFWCLHGHHCDRQRLHLGLYIPDASATPSLKTMWDLLGDMDRMLSNRLGTGSMHRKKQFQREQQKNRRRSPKHRQPSPRRGSEGL